MKTQQLFESLRLEIAILLIALAFATASARAQTPSSRLTSKPSVPAPMPPTTAADTAGPFPRANINFNQLITNNAHDESRLRKRVRLKTATAADRAKARTTIEHVAMDDVAVRWTRTTPAGSVRKEQTRSSGRARDLAEAKLELIPKAGADRASNRR